MNPANIELRIEELVLHGFDPVDRYRIAESVEAELGRLFTEGGMPPSLARRGEIRHLDVGAFEVGADLAPEAIGAGVARSLQEGLTS